MIQHQSYAHLNQTMYYYLLKLMEKQTLPYKHFDHSKIKKKFQKKSNFFFLQIFAFELIQLNFLNELKKNQVQLMEFQ